MSEYLKPLSVYEAKHFMRKKHFRAVQAVQSDDPRYPWFWGRKYPPSVELQTWLWDMYRKSEHLWGGRVPLKLLRVIS